MVLWLPDLPLKYINKVHVQRATEGNVLGIIFALEEPNTCSLATLMAVAYLQVHLYKVFWPSYLVEYPRDNGAQSQVYTIYVRVRSVRARRTRLQTRPLLEYSTKIETRIQVDENRVENRKYNSMKIEKRIQVVENRKSS